MVNWITKLMGVKDAASELKEDELGSIIVDLRDVKDGSNEPGLITVAFNSVFATVASAKRLNTRVILQCQAGISRSPAFAVAIFVYANDVEWEDAIEIVKRKVPQMQINQDLLMSLKIAFGEIMPEAKPETGEPNTKL